MAKKLLGDKFPIRPDQTCTISIEGVSSKFYACGGIGRELFWTGSYPEKTTLMLYLHLIRYASVTMDIGANIGLFTVCGAVANPLSKIFAFEPVPSLSCILKRNLLLNNLKNVVIVSKALTNDEDREKIRFYMKADDTMGSIIPGDTALEICEVPSTTLDRFCDTNSIYAKVDLIKIDVEGAEALVFEGGKHMLKHSMPIILCEVLEYGVAKDLNDIFRKLAYGFYNVTLSGLRKSERVFASTDIDNRNWLLIPKNKEYILGDI